MNKSELIKLKKLLQQETDKRNRINELLSNNLIQEFLSLNELNINELQVDDKWLILNELLKEFQITESNGILVCTNSYLTECDICYQETNYYLVKIRLYKILSNEKRRLSVYSNQIFCTTNVTAFVFKSINKYLCRAYKKKRFI